MINRLVPHTAFPGAWEKCAPGRRACCQARDNHRKPRGSELYIKSQHYLRKSKVVPSFSEILWKHALSSLAEFANVPEKVPVRSCWSSSLAVFLVFYIKHLPRGDRHTNAQACRKPRLSGLPWFLTLPFSLPMPINLFEPWSSPGWVRDT